MGTTKTIEKLSQWSQTPNEGDPMIDALLSDVQMALDNLGSNESCFEISAEILNLAIQGKDWSIVRNAIVLLESNK